MKTEPREFKISIDNYGQKGWSGPDIPWGSSLNLVERGELQKSFEQEFDELYNICRELITEFQWVTHNIPLNEHQHIRLGNALVKLNDAIPTNDVVLATED